MYILTTSIKYICLSTTLIFYCTHVSASSMSGLANPEGVYYCYTDKIAGVQPSKSSKTYSGEITPDEDKFFIKIFHRTKVDKQLSCPTNRPDLINYCSASYFAKLPKNKTNDTVWMFKSDDFGIPRKYGNSLFSYDSRIYRSNLTTLWLMKTYQNQGSEFKYSLSIVNEYGGYIETGKCDIFNNE